MTNGDIKKRSLVEFFSTTLWEMEPESYRGVRRYGVKYLQIMALVVKDFWDDQCLLRASALSFTSILSLVPFFAITFAVLKGLGVHNRIEPLILEQMAAGSQEIVDNVISYINNTNMASLGAIGLVALIVTVITLLDNIEEAFNAIWGVRETRSLYRKFSDYLSVAVSAPILILAAISITTSLQSQALTQWIMKTSYLGDLLLFLFRLVPYLSIWVALVFLYIFIPNTKVRFKSALIGGILAGTAWQAAQWGYIHFQVGVSKYNAIYGTLSVLPIFMVWIYTSWLVVLFGVEVVYAHQNIRTFRREVRSPSISHGAKELLTLAILLEIGEAFFYERPAWDSERLAAELDVPVRMVRELLEQLADAGYVVETAGENPTYQPARELEHVFIKDVLATLKNYGGSCKITKITRGEEVLQELLGRLDDCGASALGGMTLKDLVVKSSPAEAGSGDSGN
ncbi:MAG: hypothetical protein FD174_1938 [Geobacteraceae bacterium]|nr:MAG: hypothetical protein FD174_1938 [Geobacteraceae bacterium]